MPKRPESHVVGDIAVSRVTQICNECGWACETVHKDYGEDLLVQTRHRGVMDASRIWIQVRGTKNIARFGRSGGAYSLNIPLGLMLKWIRSADLVVVVLWDLRRNRGIWTIPEDSWEEFGLLLKKRKASVLFQESSVFDKNSATKIGWIARIRNYDRLVSYHKRRYLAEIEELEPGIADSKRPKPDAFVVAFDFLRLLGVISTKSLTKRFLLELVKTRNLLMSKFPGESLEAYAGQAKILAILRVVHQRTGGCPIPVTLLRECYDLLELLSRNQGTDGK
jgi:uncharacterized protein DUF4365